MTYMRLGTKCYLNVISFVINAREIDTWEIYGPREFGCRLTSDDEISSIVLFTLLFRVF